MAATNWRFVASGVCADDAVITAAHGDYIRLEVTDATSLNVIGADMMSMTVTKLWMQHSPDVVAVSVTLPSRLLVASTKSLQGNDVVLEILSSRIRLQSGSAKAELAALGRLPGVVEVPDEMWQQLSVEAATKLGQAIKTASSAMLVDPARPAVSGVRIEVSQNVVYVVGTDGARMHVVELRDVVLCAVGSFTIPDKCVGAVVDALTIETPSPPKTKKPKKGDVAVVATPLTTTPLPLIHIAVGENNVAVRVVNVDPATPYYTRTVYARRAPEPFAEWRRIAGDINGPSSGGGVVVEVAALAALLKSCPADAVTLSPRPNAIHLDYVVFDDTGTRRLGDGSNEIAATSRDGVAVSASVKVSTKYLRDALAGCGETVELVMSASQPLRLRSGDFLAVVMFMR